MKTAAVKDDQGKAVQVLMHMKHIARWSGHEKLFCTKYFVKTFLKALFLYELLVVKDRAILDRTDRNKHFMPPRQRSCSSSETLLSTDTTGHSAHLNFKPVAL